MYIHLIEPQRFPLTRSEQERLGSLRATWAIMVENSSQRERVRLISEAVGVTERTVYRHMEDAVFLFGDLLRVNKQFELNFIKEKLYLLADRAEEDGDIETARKCLSDAANIAQKLEEASELANSVELPALIFTSDPKALEEPTYEDAIVVSETDILERQAD